jgi:hypothetical protein
MDVNDWLDAFVFVVISTTSIDTGFQLIAV